MQTPKTRSKSSGAHQRNSPSSETSLKDSPQAVRELKRSVRYSNHTVSSSNQANRAPKERSPKVADRQLPKSLVDEKKPPNRVSELECLISELENDLKNVKDQLSSTEELKKQAQKDADGSKLQLSALSLELEVSQKKLLERSFTSEKVFYEAFEERDQTLELEPEGIGELDSNNSAKLNSSLGEIQQLKIELEMVVEAEAAQIKRAESAQGEVDQLKENLVETILVVQDMKNQLRDSKESEAEAKNLAGETLMQLETAKKMVGMLSSDGLKAMEEFECRASELEQSRARVNALEQLASKLKADIGNKDAQDEGDCKRDLEMIEKGRTGESVKKEIANLKLEAERLRSAIEATENNRERVLKQTRNAFEMLERMKSTASQKEAELEVELQKSRYEIDELKSNLMDNETELQGICEENEGLKSKLQNLVSGHREYELEKELKKSNAEVENLKAHLMDKETEWQSVLEENQTLKMKIKAIDLGKVNNEADSYLEAAQIAEREALIKTGYMTEEVDKSNRNAARVVEQLEEAQAANTEMESELRRIKVQSDQWRKAAEAAVAMLSTGNNGHLVERTGSMGSNYSPKTGNISSPYSDIIEEDLLKKKNANMLTRLGVLWKKQQK